MELRQMEKVCACKHCVSACKNNPGWMTVDEADRAIDAGYAKHLMLDWWCRYPDDILLLCPASAGCSGTDAPELDFFMGSKGRCVLLSKDDRCTIHDSGFKPLECRSVMACEYDHEANQNTREHIIVAGWNSERGQFVIDRWKREVNYDGRRNTDDPQ